MYSSPQLPGLWLPPRRLLLTQHRSSQMTGGKKSPQAQWPTGGLWIWGDVGRSSVLQGSTFTPGQPLFHYKHHLNLSTRHFILDQINVFARFILTSLKVWKTQFSSWLWLLTMVDSQQQNGKKPICLATFPPIVVLSPLSTQVLVTGGDHAVEELF